MASGFELSIFGPEVKVQGLSIRNNISKATPNVIIISSTICSLIKLAINYLIIKRELN
jgi:hypothetical protein